MNTTCADGFNASEILVRCNIPRSQLYSLASSSTAIWSSAGPYQTNFTVPSSQLQTSSVSLNTSSQISSPTVSDTGIILETATFSTPISLGTSAPTPSSYSSSTLTPGTIVGIAIAALFAKFIILGIVWFQCRRKRVKTAGMTQPDPQPPPEDEQKEFYTPASTAPPAELSVHGSTRERKPSELDGSPIIADNTSKRPRVSEKRDSIQ